jgi:hypothetical protein
MSVRNSRSVSPISNQIQDSSLSKPSHEPSPFKDKTNVSRRNAAEEQKVIYTGRGKTRVLSGREKAPVRMKREAEEFNQRLLDSSVNDNPQRKHSSPIKERIAALGHSIKSLVNSKRGGAQTPPLKRSVQLLASVQQDLNDGGSRDSTPARETVGKNVRWTDSIEVVPVAPAMILADALAQRNEVPAETMAALVNRAVVFSQPPTPEEVQRMSELLTEQDEDLWGTVNYLLCKPQIVRLLDDTVFDVLFELLTTCPEDPRFRKPAEPDSAPNYPATTSSATFESSPFPYYAPGHNFWELSEKLANR